MQEQGLEGLRTCRKCKMTFASTVENFNRQANARDGLRRTCRRCDTSIQGTRLGRGKYSDLRVGPLKGKDYRFREVYGITLDEYEVLLARQGGVCGVCGKAPVKNWLSVDHDHETGKVRGLLCMNCNISVEKIGKLNEYLGRT